MSEALISLLQAASKRSSKLLFRDYLELRQLQGSRDREKFARSALERTKSDIGEILSEQGIDYVFAPCSSSDELCIVNPIEGMENFTRGLPFFSIILAITKPHHGAACMINFPALQRSIYASFESGAWISDALSQPAEHRLRAPRNAPFRHLQSVCFDSFSDMPAMPESWRALNFGSGSYATLCLFTNSVDVCVLDKACPALYKAVKIINRGYGGCILEDNAMRLILTGRPIEAAGTLQRNGYK
jgi:fructose-1,6-bisphosphatase/inositol monophosphatase family enzyme